jgi:septal ring factor EnvC (AmiA/AmiB activator)
MELKLQMKTIKNIALAVAGIVGAIIAFFLFTGKRKSNKIEKLDKAVAENKEHVARIETEVKQVEKKRKAVKKEIAEVKQEIAELETVKENLVVEEKPTEEVKENILKQTRRGRPKKA